MTQPVPRRRAAGALSFMAAMRWPTPHRNPGPPRPAPRRARSRLRAVVVAAGAALFAQPVSAQQEFVGTAAVPSGFGLHDNTFALSISGTYGQWRGGAGSDRVDASAALSFGFGNAVRGVGIQADVNMTSFRNFGASGYLALTAHRMFQLDSAGVYSVALSASHLAPWGNSAWVDPGYSLVMSHLFGLDGRLAMATVGLANNLNDARDLEGVFGFGVALSDEWAGSVGWAGNQSVLGASWRPGELGGAVVSFSVRGLEDESRRLVGLDFSRSFSLTGF